MPCLWHIEPVPNRPKSPGVAPIHRSLQFPQLPRKHGWPDSEHSARQHLPPWSRLHLRPPPAKDGRKQLKWTRPSSCLILHWLAFGLIWKDMTQNIITAPQDPKENRGSCSTVTPRKNGPPLLILRSSENAWASAAFLAACAAWSGLEYASANNLANGLWESKRFDGLPTPGRHWLYHRLIMKQVLPTWNCGSLSMELYSG